MGQKIVTVAECDVCHAIFEDQAVYRNGRDILNPDGKVLGWACWHHEPREALAAINLASLTPSPEN